ncbi:hypothetical protein CANINC_002444 [Pichia inconspicua]|uniref:Peptidase M48 domain-containing protein n=1 Tax=Pichia inconspicua TaxID=52247 RepID=A0A4T0X110_9ASCO|nr:hypothetical protein CANINC_002444 [[Candida] inconspicua]
MWNYRLRNATKLLPFYKPNFVKPLNNCKLYHQRRRTPTYIYFDGRRQGYQGYQNRANIFQLWQNLNYKQKRIFYWGAGLFGVFIVSHIEEAPVTKRRRLMITADWVENLFTKMSYRQVMSQFGNFMLPESHPISRKVRKVMIRLISAAHDYVDPETGERINLFTVLGKSDIPLDQWKFYVIDDIRMGQPSPNAFVIGGGQVFIFKSILPICEDEDGLATVLGHELGHLLADHMGEKLTLSPFLITLNLVLFSIFGTTQPGDILVNAILSNSFSREMETEADYIGLMVMSRACFNPTQAPKLWKNMKLVEQRQGGSPPELLSTHPSSDRRFRNLSEWMPKAQNVYSNSGCGYANDSFGSFQNLMNFRFI